MKLSSTQIFAGSVGLVLSFFVANLHSPLAADRIVSSPAAEAFKRGDFDAALSEFRRLAEAFPGDPDVLRFEAITLDRLGRYDEAIEIFEKSLAAAPESVAGRFHLGVTYYKARREAKATNQFQLVVQLAPQSPYGKAAAQYLTTLAKQLSVSQRPGAPNPFGVYAQIAYNNDDNIPALATGVPGEREDYRGSAYLSVDYHFLRRPDWTGSVQASTYGSRYSDDKFKGFDVDQYSLSATLQRQFKWGVIPSIVSVRLEHLDVDLDNNAYSASNSGRVALRMAFTDANSTDFYYRYTRDNFAADGFDPAFSSRDAGNHVMGISPTWYFAGRDHSVQVGLEYEDNNADGVNFNHNGFNASVTTRFTLPAQVRLTLGASYRNVDYPDFAGPIRRETDRAEYWVAVSKWFGTHFLVRAHYENRDEDSTIDSLSYGREAWGVEFSYVY